MPVFLRQGSSLASAGLRLAVMSITIAALIGCKQARRSPSRNWLQPQLKRRR
jgi:hypothetical protein